MRYHKYKHKPGGYIRKRNRFGGYSTISNAHELVGCGCFGCLMPCLSVVLFAALIFVLL